MTKTDHILLSVEEMYRADRLTMDGTDTRRTSGPDLMEVAGIACADAAKNLHTQGTIAVLCGPGNNGGDGFVAARHLVQAGLSVELYLMGSVKKLNGDAAEMAEKWQQMGGKIGPLSTDSADGTGLVIDAIFGAGLARDIEGFIAELIRNVTEAGTPVVAVDVPSGIDGNTGAVRGVAFHAETTVTFFKPKTGHYLYPARKYCGQLVVADIGIEDNVLDQISPSCTTNDPAFWLDQFPWPDEEGHKYGRGHTLVFGGGIRSTGAARLASLAALRIGSGLVTLAVPASAVVAAASHLTAVMLDSYKPEEGVASLVEDVRRNTFVIGPANGVTENTRATVETCLALGRPTVLDADAISVFEGDVKSLADLIRGECVLTPHAGELKRLIPPTGDRLADARLLASETGAVVVLKGPDTIIAAPDGETTINTNGSPWLATAGSGDVLAGMIGGLMAQGMDGFDAACAAVWIHCEAATEFGPGLISEDLPELIPKILHSIRNSS